MKKKSGNSSLLEAEEAVEDYLETLLQQATETTAPVDSKPVRDNVVLLPEISLDADYYAQVPRQKEPELEAVAEDPESSEYDTKGGIEKEVSSVASSGRFEFPLQCLMFKVGETQLAIPLIELGNVVAWPQHLTRIPGANAWSCGILQHLGYNVRVVDSARLLGVTLDNEPAPPQQALILADYQWALSCDEIGQVVMLQADQVQWRQSEGKGFSLGVIKQSLAQLLSCTKMIEFLNHES